MIIKITFLDREKKPFTVLFGNSYKRWTEQVQEFLNYEIVWQDRAELRFCNISGILAVEESSAEWIGWGGLKWCYEKHFQNELNREGCQEKDPNNLNPRKYEYMRFYSAFEKKVKMMYNKRLRHLKRKSFKTILANEMKIG